MREASFVMVFGILGIAACGKSTTSDADAGIEEDVDAGRLTMREDAGPDEEDAGFDLDSGVEEDVDAGPGEPDAGPEEMDAGPVDEPCAEAGVLETVSCGRCGTTDRFCTSDLVWAYGPCMGEREDACLPGTTDTVACGDCGTQTAICNESCEWEGDDECADEGECSPGDRVRTGDGCDPGETRELLCDDACEYDEVDACMADECDTPGASERVECGLCGTQTRFCTAEGAWVYDPCEDEGVCMPGTTEMGSCGNCGMQSMRCDTSCEWVPSGACEDEGECAPGATRRSGDECPAGETRLEECTDECAYEAVEMCVDTPPVDVIFLFDMTGSHATDVTGAVDAIVDDLMQPVLRMRDTRVGIDYYADFPTTAGGRDRPFQGGVQPLGRLDNLRDELSMAPVFGGGDFPESGVEALHVLSGGDPHPLAEPLRCSSSARVAGGCWRPDAERVIVVVTDAANHNGPDPASDGLFQPYMGIDPAPAEWPAVADALREQGVRLFAVVDSGAAVSPAAQYEEMVDDLGQPEEHVILRRGGDWDAVGTTLATLLAR